MFYSDGSYFLQPDLGTALVFGDISGDALYRRGTGKESSIIICSGLAAFPLLWTSCWTIRNAPYCFL